MVCYKEISLLLKKASKWQLQVLSTEKFVTLQNIDKGKFLTIMNGIYEQMDICKYVIIEYNIYVFDI